MLGPLSRRHVGVPICFKLLAFFEHFDACEARLDSRWDFKAKVGARARWLTQVQNEEFSRVPKCFNSLSEIEYLRVLGCLGKARMSPFIGIYNV